MPVRSVLAASAAATHVSARSVAAGVDAMSAGRLGAVVAALIGVTGLVLGGLALARSTRRADAGAGAGSTRSRAVAALVAGLTGMALGALVVATADGGLGTGNGLGGGIVALLVGLGAVVLGGLALTRSRRTARAADQPAR
jgi:hypothetical protein